jgi:mono/diheme cytochrome c family protein
MFSRGLLGLSLGFSLAFIGTANAAQPDLVKRGDYLVNTILTCGNCHTPKGPTGADIMDKAFSGGLSWDEAPFKVTAPNITQDKETGIGKWSARDIRRLLRKGIKPDGTPIATIMPTGFYEIITKKDMNAIVAYVRTLKPVKNKVPDPIYKMKQVRQIFPGAERRYREAMFSDRQKHGFYLATIGHCMECHTPMVRGRHDWAKDLGRGGFEFPGPWGVSVSRNITQSKSKGIGAWSDAEIKRAITQGIDKDGKHLKPPMGYSYYAKMTDLDIADIIAYLRTVPAKE